MLKSRIRPQFQETMGMTMGLNFSGTSKTLFLTQITQICIKSISTTTYSYSG
jgi:hypothetical protein